ncbi:MAG TPA: DUF3152 domain-containing protein [Mycobacteriales bacterium]
MTRPGPATRGTRAGTGSAARGSRPGLQAGRPRGGHGRRGGRGSDPADRFAPPYRIVTLRTPDGPLRARLDPREPAGRPITFAGRSYRPAPGPLRRFVRTWGWRAYALPVLTVLTVLCGMDVANGSTGLPLVRTGSGGPAPQAAASATAGAAAAAPAPASPAKPTPTGIYVDDGGSGTSRPLPSTALPPGGPYTQRGGERYDVVAGTSKVFGSGPLHRFTVELEAGVTDDGAAFAAAVEKTLSDPHSWGRGGRASFQRIDTGVPDFRVSLTSSLTVRKLCGYDLPYETSCYNGDLARVVINDARWVRGAVAYKGDVALYRVYVINHEVGHALGNGHLQCPRNGALAPVMMQQTLGVTTPGVGTCKPNPYPFP